MKPHSCHRADNHATKNSASGWLWARIFAIGEVMILKTFQIWTIGACLTGTVSGAVWAGSGPNLRAAGYAPGHSVWLDSLNLSTATQGYGTPAAAKSVDGHPITLGGRVYPHGFGTHAESAIEIKLHGQASRFDALVGVDDETDHKGSVGFTVTVDGKIVAATRTLHGGDAPVTISVSLAGAKVL